jgi:hypothetical protein
MERRTAKYLIDVGMLVSGVLCAVTGIIKLPALLTFVDLRGMILPFYQITLVHDGSGVVFVVLIIAHLGYNWRWMATVTRSLLKGSGHRPRPRDPGRE